MIDLYQLHAFDPVTPLVESLGILQHLIRQGKIRAYGLSNYSAAQLADACRIAEQYSWILPASVQVWWNVLDRDRGTALQALAGEKKIALLPYGVLARGLLSGKYTVAGDVPKESRAAESQMLRDDMTVERLCVAERLDAYARTLGFTGAQLAVAWMRNQAGVASCVIGVRSIAQLSEMVAATEWRLTEGEMIHVDQIDKQM